ncbi:MAG: deoxyribodipyrimidine photo-lyase [Actinomycetia bacterium]|nr:deoxyribodipyrimidine photo-lyase [Actinomycetes bacterium]
MPSRSELSEVAIDDRPGLVWFRRDLRLDDNPAWAAATTAHRQVVAVFVLEPSLMNAAGQVRRDQILAHLHALDDELRAVGGALVVRPGPAPVAIPQVVSDCEASAVYLNADASALSATRDDETRRALPVPVHSFHGLTVHEPGAVLTQKGTLARVFTPFYRTWSATARSPWPSAGSGRPATLPGITLPSPRGPVRQAPGERAAWERLTLWLDDVDDYVIARDSPAADGTSDLSADLKSGTLAARTVVDVVGTSTPGREAFVRQLAWRDWWAHTLTGRPDLAEVALRRSYGAIEWRDDAEGFERWCTGTTGFPIVDAGMRQLVQTGWMHGRVRMLCASFLVKDLLIDWRWGERFFRRLLADGDVAQNVGNWQWVAGTGPDAAPYFRVFNPTVQARRFDPGGDYVRRWVPELAGLPPNIIHEPGAVSPLELAAGGVILGDNYPEPIVDHAEARARTLDAYRRAAGTRDDDRAPGPRS